MIRCHGKYENLWLIPNKVSSVSSVLLTKQVVITCFHKVEKDLLQAQIITQFSSWGIWDVRGNEVTMLSSLSISSNIIENKNGIELVINGIAFPVHFGICC